MLHTEIMNSILDFTRSCRIEFKSCVELGSSGGELELKLLDAFPSLRIESYNLSSKEQVFVESKLIFYQGRFHFIGSDYRKEKIGHGYDMALSPFDFIGMTKEEKQRLFVKILHALAEGGLFIYGDAVKSPSERIKMIYVQRETRGSFERPSDGAGRDELLNKHPGNHHMLSIDDQMYWMRKAAFKDVDCIYKFFNIAVFVGFK